MLIPNLNLSYKKRTGTNVYGVETWSETKNEPCAIVRLRLTAQHSTVRADASGTRGYAEEFAASTKILVMADTAIEIGDQITIQGVTLKVTSKFPRHAVTGRLDHYEVQGVPWV